MDKLLDPKTVSACDMLDARKAALVVVKPELTLAEIEEAVCKLHACCGEQMVNLLAEEGLASLWYHRIAANDVAAAIPGELLETLRQVRLADWALYLAQKEALSEIDSLFATHRIVYAAFKGAHVREALYTANGLNPAVRLANDIDILVDSDQREAAARILIEAGYSMRVNPGTLSHEVGFVKGPTVIDLHWDLLRPGRTRVPVTRELLAGRQWMGWFWGLSDTDAVFVMLVHPAFVRYACNLALCSVIDFLFYSRDRHVDWDAVAVRLDQTGLKTAAWTMVSWYALLAEEVSICVPKQFVERIRPGLLRASYLSLWLNHYLPVRWWNARAAIQLGFTLFLHDRPSDAVRAVIRMIEARKAGQSDAWAVNPMQMPV